MTLATHISNPQFLHTTPLPQAAHLKLSLRFSLNEMQAVKACNYFFGVWLGGVELLISFLLSYGVYDILAKDAYAFLLKWFKRFPQYKYRDFHMAGESYAGHYISQLAQVIITKNRGIIEPVINLKGFLVGNPSIDFSNGGVGRFEYLWSHGLISDTSYDNLMRFCSFNSWESTSTDCDKTYSRASIELGNINGFNILTRPCEDGQNYLSNFRVTQQWMYGGAEFCLENYTNKYLNRLDVQKAFHVNISHIPSMWKECSAAAGESWGDRSSSVLPILRDLIVGGLRIWLFSGDADAVVPLTSTRYSIRELKLKTLQNWYPWFEGRARYMRG